MGYRPAIRDNRNTVHRHGRPALPVRDRSSPEVSETTTACRYLPQFLEAISDEVGLAELSTILGKAGLPGEWADPEHIRSLEGIESARAYAGLQRALRTYYGRGARGTLIRTGRNLWLRLLSGSSLAGRLQALFVRALPVRMRLQPALRALTGLLANRRGELTIHTMDLDLLVCDHASPGTLDQNEGGSICFVTLGLLQACLMWAGGLEYEVEETSCRAAGGRICEFKIRVGGN